MNCAFSSSRTKINDGLSESNPVEPELYSAQSELHDSEAKCMSLQCKRVKKDWTIEQGHTSAYANLGQGMCRKA